MSEQDSIAGLTDVNYEDIVPSVADEKSRARARWKILSKGGPFSVSPDLCNIWPGNTRDVQALGSGSFLDLMDSLKSVGQKVPAIARIAPDAPDRLEIIAGACRLTAIRQINETRGDDDPMQILVDLRDLDDAAAIKIVDAENRGRSDMSQYEKALFYDRAIPGTYPTEAAFAEALGLNKSTVNRTLAITRLPPAMMGIIKDRHAISAAQASSFMRDWNMPEFHDTLSDTIDALSANGPQSAATVFKALEAVIAPPADANSAEIVIDGTTFGSLQHSKSGVTIKLLPTADSVMVKPLIIAIGHALKQIGFK
ncbi:MAG: ParB/RepB/Spo0J family partition protein [Sphingopyxis sp.]|nr:ParB/RepB/Spo0J family partition protein [Sphingopyxis sp.]OGT54954.1 MAG: hypothetical protein A3E01_11775 [Gammaproteobacteria bacterium RIFCSPHIGHO2_12_FULL_63_22]